MKKLISPSLESSFDGLAVARRSLLKSGLPPLTWAGLALCGAYSPAIFAQAAAPSYLPEDQEVVQLDPMQVDGRAEASTYAAERSLSAARTSTPLLDTPQSVSVITRELIDDTAMRGIADLTRYVPGVGIGQGEGNRDTPIMRGNSTTADFFIDGIRDDVQYFRDLYNVDRVEVLKGPNAMIFGRGGSGGVINRVAKRASLSPRDEVSLQVGSWDQYRATADVGGKISSKAALRLNAMHEDADSYRDAVTLRRTGANPTAAFFLAPTTQLHVSYEYFRDERVADRGVSSFAGRPLDVDPAKFFGDPAQSTSRAVTHGANVTLEHRTEYGASLRNNFRFGHYDKFYQNVYPGAVNGAGTEVAISAYNNANVRDNWYNQIDVVLPLDTGSVHHELLLGAELGRQNNENVRLTGYFPAPSGSPTIASISVPIANPRTTTPATFLPSATDANNTTAATTGALYVQDQATIASWLQAIGGVRVERLEIELFNRRASTRISAVDNPVSPRLGLVIKPRRDLSGYIAYSISNLPRAGEQLSSLTSANRSLAPEKFRNLETGLKWDIRPDFVATAAVYQLERRNVAATDPADATKLILVDGQTAIGFELGVAGRVTTRWSVAGGYALQEGEIDATQSATVVKAARLAQLPRHAASLWNRFELTDRLGLGLGVIYRDSFSPSTDNRVRVPDFLRFDAAAFLKISTNVRVQLNVENLADRRYYATAHTNTNITPGSPRAVRVSVTTNW